MVKIRINPLPVRHKQDDKRKEKNEINSAGENDNRRIVLNGLFFYLLLLFCY